MAQLHSKCRDRMRAHGSLVPNFGPWQLSNLSTITSKSIAACSIRADLPRRVFRQEAGAPGARPRRRGCRFRRSSHQS